MADYLGEALAKIQQQSLANNPYAQFGSVLSQAKNPYATADDPWGALAANAAQSLLGGIASGYGQGQVNREMGQIAPLVPQLYADPMAATNPGIDAGMFGSLQVAAQNDRASRQKELQDLFLSESVKQQLNPQAPLFQIQASREKMRYARELGALLGVDPNQIAAASGQTPSEQLPQGQLPAAEQVFKAPATVPTQQPQNQPQAPEAGLQEVAVPNQQAEFQRLMATGMDYDAAMEAANKNVADAIKFNRDLKMESLKQSGAEKELKTKAELEQNAAYDKAAMERSATLSSLDQNMSLLEGAIEDLPDYGMPVTGDLASMFDQFAARTPMLGKMSSKANKNLSASSTVSTAAPAIAGALLKEAKLNPVTEKELEFVLKAYPSTGKTKEQNRAIITGLKQGRDLLKFDTLFTQAYRKRGLTPAQINQKLEEERARMGGSFYENGYLKPEIVEATAALSNILGGKL